MICWSDNNFTHVFFRRCSILTIC